MAGVDERDPDAVRHVDRLVIGRNPPEPIEGAERVENAVERLLGGGALAAEFGALRAALCLFLLLMRRVEQHQLGQLARRRGRDDLAPEPALDQQRNAAAVVEMRVGEQQDIDRGRDRSRNLRR